MSWETKASCSLPNLASPERSLWTGALEALSSVDYEPEPGVVSFLARGPQSFGYLGLDLGCGFGRHVLAGARLGFRMVGVDCCDEAVRVTRRMLQGHRQRGEVLVGGVTALPFSEGAFDFAIANCVLSHGTHFSLTQGISEIVRVLRRGGVLFGSVLSSNDPRHGDGVPVEDGSFVFTRGPEKGICHCFMNEAALRSILESVCHVDTVREVRYSGRDVGAYYPGLPYSSHLAFTVRKR